MRRRGPRGSRIPATPNGRRAHLVGFAVRRKSNVSLTTRGSMRWHGAEEDRS